MHNYIQMTDDLFYVGGSDRRIALFENIYPVPRGVSYNSYLIKDEKTVLFDTVDPSVADLFLENVEAALGGRALDCLVVHHVEPDHSATFMRLLKTYPNVKLVTSAKAVQMLGNFFPFRSDNVQIVKEGDVFSTGKHSFQFISAPMVHWPEVMFSFDTTTGTLFSADAFGTFGALGGSIYADEVHFERDFLNDARRYYFNIVGKYGVQVQAALKKAQELDIKTICPLHGPVWRNDIGWYLSYYAKWSAYESEEKGVAIFYGSIHGHTANAAEILASKLCANGVKNIAVYDVSKTDLSELLSEAFRYSHLVFAGATYNNGVFINLETLLNDLRAHGLQNKKFSVLENGSWSPQAGKQMIELWSALKGCSQVGEKVTMLSTVKEDTVNAIEELALAIAADM